MTTQDITFTVTSTGGRPAVTVRAEGPFDDLTLEIKSRNAIQDVLLTFPDDLQRVRDILWQPSGQMYVLDWDRVTDGFAAMRSLGIEVLLRLFHPDHCQLLISYFRQVWGTLPFDIFGERSPRLTIRGDDISLIPLEFVPLLSQSAVSPITGEEGMYAAASAFPAFFALVVREPLADTGGRLSDDKPRDFMAGDPSLRVRAFVHDNLGGAVREIEDLRAKAPRIVLQGEFPTNGMTTSSVVEEIFKRGADVLHFSCHCGRDRTLLGEVEINLKAGSTSLNVTQQDLRAETYRKVASPEPLDSLAPLVILNACGSSNPTLMSGSSLPRFFLEGRSNTIIGIETFVPDTVARTIARYFYEFLLRGDSAVIALHRARCRVLRLYRNPIGCFYVTFLAANTKQTRVFRPRALEGTVRK